jgi:hypothetical protein
MLRSRLQSQLQLLALPQLLCSVPSSSTHTAAAGALVTAAAAATTAADARHAAGQQLRPLRWYAADAQPQESAASSEVARAAHELGLDAVPLEELKSAWRNQGRGRRAGGGGG